MKIFYWWDRENEIFVPITGTEVKGFPLKLFVSKMPYGWCITETTTGEKFGNSFDTRKEAIDDIPNSFEKVKKMGINIEEIIARQIKSHGKSPY